jgi:hypothetical protein
MGELEHSTFYTWDPIMSTNLQYLVHFIQHRVSEIVITIPEVQSAIINSGNKITSSGKR